MNVPFNMIILGMTACGKTHYLLEMLEKDFLHTFDNIFLICPTFVHNKTYQNWKYKNDERFITIPCDHDSVEDWLKTITWYAECTTSLIILDDCAAGQDVKNRTGELVKLGFSARHIGLSTIVITQQLTSIAKPYRDNVKKIVTFYNPNSTDFNGMLKNFLGYVEKGEIKKIIETLKSKKHARLEINLISPYDHTVVVPQ